jgi:hypothetical protein
MTELMCNTGQQLVTNNHCAARDIKNRMNNIQDMWAKLRDQVQKRRTRLEDAAESHQVRKYNPKLFVKITFYV